MMAEIRRPLSAVERWYWLSDQFSALNVISRVRVHGRLSIDDLRRGLDALQARHPLLRGGGGGGGGQNGGRKNTARYFPPPTPPPRGPLTLPGPTATDAGAHDLLVVV
ncbi:condensation domain-containing protein, partial [Pseudomonas aeruginosa]